ncbi:MAG: LolA family protein [Gammaproteobacteria bacterium]
MLSRITRYILAAGISFSPLAASSAEDSFSAVMARMKPQSPVSIHYEEIRHLELLDKPWHGNGFLYALPPDKMLKEQWRPQRELMGTDGKLLYYYDPSSGVRHSTELRSDDPAAAHIEAFRALFNGDRALLDRLYRVEFLSTPERWQLTLLSKTPEVSAVLAKIVVSGAPEKPADRLEILQADGDRSELKLRPESREAAQQLRRKVEILYRELQGNP